MKKLILFLMTVSFIVAKSQAQEKTNPANQSEELGAVSWYRDYNTALILSQKEGKPVLILFQEVPGCMTCRNYGQNVLSHPLLVDAIEQLFIPLAIYNNKKGKDAEVLQRYGEPAWNNPVVRIVNAEGADLTERVSGNYSRKGLYQAMEAALLKSGKEIPAVMLLLKQEISSNLHIFSLPLHALNPLLSYTTTLQYSPFLPLRNRFHNIALFYTSPPCCLVQLTYGKPLLRH
jgi:Thioredoxin-like